MSNKCAADPVLLRPALDAAPTVFLRANGKFVAPRWIRPPQRSKMVSRILSYQLAHSLFAPNSDIKASSED